MISVCITGRMGCGKTHVCGILASWGHPVYNCDREAKRLMLTDPEVMAGIVRLVGPDAYSHDDLGQPTLNKPLIAAFLYASPLNTHRLNAVVHPAVREDARQWLSRQRGAEFAFIECAIPWQSGIDGIVGHTLSVVADENVQWERIRRRDHLSDEEIKARLARQDDAPPVDEAGHQPLRHQAILNNGNEPLEPVLAKALAHIRNVEQSSPSNGANP